MTDKLIEEKIEEQFDYLDDLRRVASGEKVAFTLEEALNENVELFRSALLSIRAATIAECKKAMGEKSDYPDEWGEGYNFHRSESLNRLKELKNHCKTISR